jgi:hypothetical protein
MPDKILTVKQYRIKIHWDVKMTFRPKQDKATKYRHIENKESVKRYRK